LEGLKGFWHPDKPLRSMRGSHGTWDGGAGYTPGNVQLGKWRGLAEVPAITPA
jgi:hypothetical protein